jgi:hypothetical protein
MSRAPELGATDAECAVFCAPTSHVGSVASHITAIAAMTVSSVALINDPLRHDGLCESVRIAASPVLRVIRGHVGTSARPHIAQLHLGAGTLNFSGVFFGLHGIDLTVTN